MDNALKDMLQRWFTDWNAVELAGDYTGPDGLLYCGKCQTPKEVWLDLWQTPKFDGCTPRYVKRPVMCKCEQEAKDEEERRIKEEENAKRMERNRAACFDIPGWGETTFAVDDRREVEASKICRSFVEKFQAVRTDGQGMIFSGGAGTGKTFLAACVANALLDQGYRVKFTSLMSLNSQMSANYANDKQRTLDNLASCDLVIIDELGLEKKTDTANENAYQVVNTLVSAKVPMILTTNLPLRQIAGDTEPSNIRIYSRILGNCYPVRFVGRDGRRDQLDGKKWAFIEE